MKTTALRLCVIGAMLLSFAGCNSDPPVTPNDSVYAQPPEITGVAIVNERGMDCGWWGELNDNRYGDGAFQLHFPYPNPFMGTVSVTFRNTDTVTVSIWAVHGIGPGEESSGAANQSIGTPVSIPCRPIMMVRDRVFFPGVHTVTWDTRNNSDSYIPSGFCRIYCTADTQLYWVDALRLTPDQLQKYPDMLDMVAHCFYARPITD